jgi:hypothetical protein
MSGSDHFLLLRVHGAMDAETTASFHRPSPDGSQERPGGCAGPYCSRRSDPPTTPTPYGTSRISQWAVLEEPLPVNAPHESGRLRDAIDARPIRAAEAIFHPPRLTSLAD